MTSTSMSSRHRALLGALLIFCIGSLLTLSMRPISENSEWVVSRRPSSGTGAQGGSESSSTSDERTGTGGRGTDQENNSDLDSSSSLSTYSLQSLQALVRGTILETSEDLLDSTRNIRPRSSLSSGSPLHGGPRLDLKPDDLNPEPGNDEDEDTGADEEDEINGNESEPEDEDEDLSDDQTTDDLTQVSDDNVNNDSIDQTNVNDEQPEDEDLSESHEDLDQSKEHITKIDTTLDEALEDDEEASPTLGSSLADFDISGRLDPTANYLLFVPSGETIEGQFFSLLTSLWIAKHSNRTLIIPPPMMSPPSLDALYPYFAGPKGRKRQRWSTLFDLRLIMKVQSAVLIDNTRPVLQTPFTEEMALEEENPTTDEQAIPFLFEDDDEGVNDDQDPTPARTIPVKIKCYGPPTAGSWKGLDFSGRHFLNRYNLVADFEILEDAYWNLRPTEIQKYWRATPSFGPSSATDKITTHHQQLACISGAEFVGREDAAMEEMIWQDLGLQISFSRGVKQQALQSIVQVLRAVEGDAKRNGYIGVHIDKLPSPEICHRGVSSSPVNNDAGNKNVNNGAAKLEELHAPPPPQNAALATSSPVLSQCHWTVDLIAKRIAILQLTEGVIPRPVLVTTTETDPEILAKIDQRGWLRVGSEEFGAGLFDEGDDLGGYGNQVARAYVMANSAIFVGSRASALSIHAAFTIKNQGKLRQVPPRWELY
ncbi:hypothetical protein BG006_006551 [Podila minutissima]|uniref:Uncharacterized protein n=1 Tax=Podila minutissima TaxID=64525 RepID=A0A9P5SJ61_9FUNG|nr:hypothetical protein BG006_006551 [Podila minutissima]